ncbi:Gfo/Idh/MocA family oxidoreductase [Oceanibaculum pacificum]|uniref:Gfo/Idh/MocA-like oxidoreductase N-terminal domain-containing protein n=1 Tax=Oceanibaculum pacificum TaxID=580166 RepID=A0A154WFD1_9PROT|nr:Gfo/Idh/MocA family oxidoreductase [Oceanibaculum pacificum]KZD12196.1 hypothetical protein AUP43_05165 [Oceanibaculum pacificum]
MRILLIGAGRIAGEYVKALQARGPVEIDILSRTEASAAGLRQRHGLAQAFWGGQDRLASLDLSYDGYIVATPIETLLPYLVQLTRQGARRILVEKPVCLSSAELRAFLHAHPQATAMAALNRLYYPSVQALADRLAVEPATSASFSFGEMLPRIEAANLAPPVLARLGLANSIHVIATVFSLIGLPRLLHPLVSGQGRIDWHPSGAVFAGAGSTESGICFTYLADWLSAGRWSMTVRTGRGVYMLEPVETLSFQPLAGGPAEMLVPPVSDGLKCGFPQMLEAWLAADAPDAKASLYSLLAYLEAIEAMMGYRGDGVAR